LLDFDANVYRNRTATDQTKIAGTGDPSSGFIGNMRNFTINTTGFDANNTTCFDTGPWMQHALNIGADSFHDQVGTTGFGTIFTPSGERTVSGNFWQSTAVPQLQGSSSASNIKTSRPHGSKAPS
jgi:hemoglobin/transferrin/lactoferrin receptor protein